MGLALAPVQTMWRALLQWGSAFAKTFKEQCVTWWRLRWVMKLWQRSSWPTLLKRSPVPGEDEQRNHAPFWMRISSRHLPSSLTHTKQNLALAPHPTSWHMSHAVLPTDPTWIYHIYCFWLGYGNTTVLFLSLVHKVTQKEKGKKESEIRPGYK